MPRGVAVGDEISVEMILSLNRRSNGDGDPRSNAGRIRRGHSRLTDSLEDGRVVIVPVPFVRDDVVSHTGGGARQPPSWPASHQIDLYDVETGRPYRAGIPHAA